VARYTTSRIVDGLGSPLWSRHERRPAVLVFDVRPSVSNPLVDYLAHSGREGDEPLPVLLVLERCASLGTVPYFDVLLVGVVVVYVDGAE
jgi:hypothetical protein